MSDTTNTSAGTIPPEAQAVLDQIDSRNRRFRINMVIAFAVLLLCGFGMLVVIKLDFKFMYKWIGWQRTA